MPTPTPTPAPAPAPWPDLPRRAPVAVPAVEDLARAVLDGAVRRERLAAEQEAG